MVNEILPRVSTAVPIIGIPNNTAIVIYDTYHVCPYIKNQASVLYILSSKNSTFHFLFSRNAADRKGCPFTHNNRWKTFNNIKQLQSFLKMVLHRCSFVICWCQLLDLCVSKDFKKYLFRGRKWTFFSLGNFLTRNISGVTVLLALTVFNTMVNEILPKVSDALPILG